MWSDYLHPLLVIMISGTIGVTILSLLRGLVLRLRGHRMSVRYLLTITVFAAIGLAIFRTASRDVRFLMFLLLVYPLLPLLLSATSGGRLKQGNPVDRDQT